VIIYKKNDVSCDMYMGRSSWFVILCPIFFVHYKPPKPKTFKNL